MLSQTMADASCPPSRGAGWASSAKMLQVLLHLASPARQ
jgi:hypothetical protein